MVTIRIPALPPGLLSNLLGLAGLVAVVVAVGGLTGNWWWSVLAGGVAAVSLAVMAQAQPRTVEEGDEETTAEIPRLRSRTRPA